MDPLHIHLLNEPEIAMYGMRPESVRALLADLAGRSERLLTVSESVDPGAVTDAMRAADIMIGHRFPLKEIRDLPRLRWIHLVSAGIDHLLPLDWLPRRVALTTSRGMHGALAGDYVLGALLALNIGIPQYRADQERGRWAPAYTTPLGGKTVVLIGVGAIGGAVAETLKRHGLRVLGVRRTGKSHRHVDEMFTPDRLREVLPRAAFVVVAAPLTPHSRRLLGRAELDMLPPAAGLVNISRAGVVDYEALAEKLTAGVLRGAYLDVFDPEPLPPASPLWQVPNLVMTPHISCDYPPLEYGNRTLAIFTDSLRRYLAGRPLRNAVGRRRGY